MGGEITATSVPGEGATFRFWIAAPACAAPDAGPAATPLVPVRGKRILLAEDNALNRQILTAYLELGGHSVRVVENGACAVEAAASERFDLVLMDVQMPEMDGLSATRLIRALPAPACNVPILALTASAMDGDRDRCLAVGMTDFCAKPVTPDALQAAIVRASHIPADQRCA